MVAAARYRKPDTGEAGMLKEFKAFIMRGNVVELAVAVVIGAAFGAVVKSLVEDLFTPLLAIPGSADFSTLDFTISGSSIRYGLFLNAVIAFLMVAAAIFFVVVRPLQKMADKRGGDEVDLDEDLAECPECLSEVPRAARRCRHCTSVLTGTSV